MTMLINYLFYLASHQPLLLIISFFYINCENMFTLEVSSWGSHQHVHVQYMYVWPASRQPSQFSMLFSSGYRMQFNSHALQTKFYLSVLQHHRITAKSHLSAGMDVDAHKIRSHSCCLMLNPLGRIIHTNAFLPPVHQITRDRCASL